MKKFLILLAVLFLLIMTGCRTIEYVYPEYELPVEPQREDFERPKTIKELGLIIKYYDSLVLEWEQWAMDTKEIITTKD